MTRRPERILIVRPSALGDVARTAPALVSLRRAWPGAKIDWLVRDDFAEAVAHHPDLSAVMPFPRQALSRFGRSWRVTRRGWAYLRDLRRRRYDVVYDLQGLSRSGGLAWATRAPRRVGPADARELAWLAYNRRVRIDPGVAHTVDRMLAVIESDGVTPVRDMRLHVGAADRTWAQAFLSERGLTAERFAVLAPTAAWKSKRWPIRRFGQLGDRLKGHGFEACVVVGSQGERAQTAPLFADKSTGDMRRLDLVGGTSIGRLMAIIERCGLVVANDSAALHLAVGLERRAVGLFGPTDPRRVGPYRYKVGVVEGGGGYVNRGSYRAATPARSPIRAITLDKAEAAVERVMAAPPPGGAENSQRRPQIRGSAT